MEKENRNMSTGNRFNSIRNTQGKGAPMPVAAPKPAEEPGVTIVGKAKDLADQEQAIARSALGLAMDESAQAYVNGTKMLACGEERARELRRDFEALPMFADVLDSTEALISAEKRRDETVKASELYVDRDGLLRRDRGDGKPGLGLVMNGRAYQEIASFGPKTLDSGLRYNLNLWTAESDKTIVLRTRNPNTHRTGPTRACYAAVSESYTAFDLDRVCRELRGKFPKDSRGEIFYDGARWSISAVLAPTMEAGEIGVGRVFRSRVKIGSADDRTSSLWALAQAERIRCINCTTITDSRYVFSERHMGNVGALFATALAAQAAAMRAFSELWAEANKRAIVDSADGGKLEPTEVFKRLVANGYLDAIPGGKRAASDIVVGLMSAYEAEPLSGAAGVNAAITRYAHEQAGSWRSVWTTEAIEEQAGRLLFDRVFELPKLSKVQAETFAA